MRVSDRHFRRLLDDLDRSQGHEGNTIFAVFVFLTVIGVSRERTKTLRDMYERDQTARYRKKYGNRSRSEMDTDRLAFAAASVHLLREIEGVSERDALKRVAEASKFPAKTIENFIDEYQRKRLKAGKELYECAKASDYLRDPITQRRPLTFLGPVPDEDRV